MPKKIFDILPPRRQSYTPEKSKQRKEPKKIVEEPVVRKSTTVPASKRFSWRIFIFCLLVILILAGFFVSSIFSGSEIELWLKIEDLKFKEQITVDSKANQSDLSLKIFSGQIFEEEKSTSQEFSPSGRVTKETKARGTIRVYNDYSTMAQPLVTTTRFVSTDGKLFKSLKREVIPGAVEKNGKLTPSSVDIEVEAAEGGAEYNINPSTFSIPGFAGTPKYTGFYGKSFSPMTGGFKGEIPQVNQRDLDQAKKFLVEKIKQESKESLQSKNSPDFILLDKALFQELLESKSSADVKSEVELFTYTVKIKSRWTGFKKTDIETFLQAAKDSRLPAEKVFKEGSLEIIYTPESVDLEAGKINLNLDVKAKIYSALDLDELKKNLGGKTINEVRIFLENQPQIAKIKIKVWPFWIKKMPTDVKEIKVKATID